ncbi:50S ribosomal protein L11 methyltransferase [bacterium]|jgi:ribosomal protein L11 methyltransferase|nr:50S ribosomal protein L11 methyltransferase [bacterium]MDA9025590.1 50S ribosomal protein L11 methyltransferase [bacterium]MDA9342335.1 50S ribosomal protein L11 methyltransferase [Flavobacteriaceae bacterium]MDB9994168.1 50S ribosomal protein L11 methyltransferase [Flavobacteriaceae bacterium]
MSQIYIEYHFTMFPLQPTSEILVAQLGELGFESFTETETGLKAYIQKKELNPSLIDDIQALNSLEFEISYKVVEIPQVNWNAEWEKNFNPIEVNGECALRAPFHPPFNVKYEIIIEPKMSFGTGHHETTFMMLQFILENDFKEKSVIDMGCGTAVLAILSEMKGAAKIDAVDIDEWCYENSIENIERNICKNISVYKGDASFFKEKKYEVIIANINRNILLQDMEIYFNGLEDNGTLYLSGFYKEDLELISETCNNLGLTFVENKVRNNWIAAKFRK